MTRKSQIIYILYLLDQIMSTCFVGFKKGIKQPFRHTLYYKHI